MFATYYNIIDFSCMMLLHFPLSNYVESQAENGGLTKAGVLENTGNIERSLDTE